MPISITAKSASAGIRASVSGTPQWLLKLFSAAWTRPCAPERRAQHLLGPGLADRSGHRDHACRANRARAGAAQRLAAPASTSGTTSSGASGANALAARATPAPRRRPAPAPPPRSHARRAPPSARRRDRPARGVRVSIETPVAAQSPRAAPPVAAPPPRRRSRAAAVMRRARRARRPRRSPARRRRRAARRRRRSARSRAPCRRSAARRRAGARRPRRRIASARSPISVASGQPSSTAARIAAGSSRARVVVGDEDDVGARGRRAPISGRLPRSRSPPAPKTTTSRPMHMRPQRRQRRAPARPAYGRSRRRPSRRSPASRRAASGPRTVVSRGSASNTALRRREPDADREPGGHQRVLRLERRRSDRAAPRGARRPRRTAQLLPGRVEALRRAAAGRAPSARPTVSSRSPAPRADVGAAPAPSGSSRLTTAVPPRGSTRVEQPRAWPRNRPRSPGGSRDGPGVRLVNPAAASRTPSSRCWSSPWVDASIAAWVTPASASSASSACSVSGSGVVWVSGRETAPSTPDGAEVHRALAERLPDLPGEARDRGLAVGAGHRDHHLGLVAGPARRGQRERPARIVGKNDRHAERPGPPPPRREPLGGRSGSPPRPCAARRARTPPPCARLPGSAANRCRGFVRGCPPTGPVISGSVPTSRPRAGAGQQAERLEAHQLVRPIGSRMPARRHTRVVGTASRSRRACKAAAARPGPARPQAHDRREAAQRLGETGAAVRPAVRNGSVPLIVAVGSSSVITITYSGSLAGKTPAKVAMVLSRA